MSRRETRDFRASRTAAERVAALRAHAQAISAALPGDERIEITGFDATTGNASRVASVDAAPQEGDLIAAAEAHATRIGPAFGTGAAPPEFVPDLALQRTSAGEYVVHLQQCHKGIPIFQSAISVRLDARRRIVDATGSVIAVERVDDARLPVAAAVRVAAAELAAAATGDAGSDQFGQPLPRPLGAIDSFEPKVVAAFSALSQTPTVLEPGPFAGPIQASLTWFPTDAGLVLAWEVSLPRPGDGTLQRSVVSGRGELLYAQQLTHGLTAEADVYEPDGAAPRARRPFPLAAGEYAALVPSAAAAAAFPDWVDAGAATAGNTTIAHVDGVATTVAGSRADGGGVVFSPADAVGDDQKVVNLFYYCCKMHDLFYLLGFREQDGNFEVDNHAAGGVGSDRVDAHVCLAEIPRTASFVTPPDGSSPTMLMGPVTATGRHCAMDASVVFHEWTHGVSNRLVGGPATASGLMSPQSLGMGEGWSDFVACVLTGADVVAAWVVDDPKGIRAYPFDADYPDGFDKLGTGRYVSSPHNVGEIWCATLMEMSRNVGVPVSLQLIVDAMKLSAPNPSFLNMRDSLLAAAAAHATAAALDAAARAALTDGIWRAFAKFGMGPKAACNGAQLEGIVADFRAP